MGIANRYLRPGRFSFMPLQSFLIIVLLALTLNSSSTGWLLRWWLVLYWALSLTVFDGGGAPSEESSGMESVAAVGWLQCGYEGAMAAWAWCVAALKWHGPEGASLGAFRTTRDKLRHLFINTLKVAELTHKSSGSNCSRAVAPMSCWRKRAAVCRRGYRCWRQCNWCSAGECVLSGRGVGVCVGGLRTGELHPRLLVSLAWAIVSFSRISFTSLVMHPYHRLRRCPACPQARRCTRGRGFAGLARLCGLPPQPI